MNIAFYSAATGMIAQQGGMNVTANNIANVNTVGYKALRPSFADCIYTEQRATEPEWDTGHGQYMNKTDFQWDIGGFTDYGQPLDYALPNDGFFMVRDSEGRDYLTRDGAFQITNVGDHWELVNAGGDFVLDYEGNHITVPFVAETEGENDTATTEIDYPALTEMIGVFTVPNKWGLAQADGNHFLVTDRSGAPEADLEADKLQYYLERSSVDIAQEMVNMIVSQRSYQLNDKIVQTADEMQQIANNLR